MVVSLFLVGEKSFPLLNFNFFFGCAGSSLLHGLSLVVVSGGYSLVAVRRFLKVVTSFVMERRL